MSIQRSEQLDQLFDALSKVQGKIENAKKNKTGYAKNHTYADLNQYIEASKDLLSENDLCVMQMPGPIEIVKIIEEIGKPEIIIPKQTITTWIGHKSGQFISSSMEILIEKTKANSWGASTGVAVSYGRRYALGGSLGMTQEDDDNRLYKNEGDKYYSPNPDSRCINKKKVNETQVNYLISLLKDEPERLKAILEWATTLQDNVCVSTPEDLWVTTYTTAVNIIIKNQKDKEIAANKHPNLISEHQVAYLTRLVSVERLSKILKDYNLTKLEEMNVNDYHKEYNNLRLEMTTDQEMSSTQKTNYI